ncbi:MAG TPA: hypothetical protein VFT65_03780 [Candidatus Angelobacter sp.]|nr:hypothetical protein [Candidatus Angelobacter sp.]
MKIQQVTQSGNAGASSLSPDGRYIVYVTHDGAQESLWVRQVATGGNIQVIPPEQAHYVAVSFTPDGNYVMFVRSDKSTVNFRYLYQMPVLGGTPQRLLRDIDSAPAFSPDGRQIAFVRGILDPPGNNILIANADGSEERLVSARIGFPPGSAAVSWSADGQTLAVVSPETRDGNFRWVVMTISVQTGAARDLHAFNASAQALAWLPDGRGVLVVATDLESGRGQIFFVSYPEGEVSRFTNDLTNYSLCCMEVTRDGNSLVALQDTTSSDIWVAKADGSEARQVTSGAPLGLGLDWIGNQIVAANSRFQWMLMKPDGSDSTPLTNDRDPHLQLSACPDGKHVSYTTWHNGTLQLWRANSDGSNAKKFDVGSLVGGGLCSWDSKSVFYASDKGLWEVPIEGGTPVKLNLPFAVYASSRDGKLRLTGSQRLDGDSYVAQMVVVPAAGGKPLKTFDAPYGLQTGSFTPDSSAIAFLINRNHATNIWEQKLSGGDPIQITKFTSGDMFAFAWSGDGRQLAFSRGQRKSDVVMISNFH